MKILNILKLVTCGAALLLPFISNGQSIPRSQMPRRTMPPFVYGQGIPNVPLGVMPMQFNGSFAGESEGARLSTAFTYDFGSGSDFNNLRAFGYHASFDTFIPALRSGLGISLHRGKVTEEMRWGSTGGSEIRNMAFTSNRVSVAFAPKFSIDGKYTISPSVDLSYGRGNTEANFPAVIGPLDYARSYPPGQHQWLESRIGLLFNTSKYYIGYAANIINRHFHDQEESGLLSDQFISYVQAGYTFQRSADTKFSFTPQLAYRIGGNEGMAASDYFFNGGVINLTFRYDKYLAGFNNTGFHIGWQNERLRIMSTTNPFFHGGSRSLAVGNLSARYVFKE